jgi:hypothetical protein
LFAQTKLQPDTSIVFEDKASLKHLVIPQRQSKLVWYMSSFAAAAVMLLFMFFWFDQTEESGSLTASSGFSATMPGQSDRRGGDIYENRPYQVEDVNGQTINTMVTDDNINKRHLWIGTIVKREEVLPHGNRDVQLNDRTELSDNKNTTLATNNDNLYDLGEIKQTEQNDQPVIPVANNNANKPKPNTYQKPADNTITGFDVLSFGLKTIARMSGKDWKLQKQYNKDGKVSAIAFYSSKVEVYAPVKKK